MPDLTHKPRSDIGSDTAGSPDRRSALKALALLTTAVLPGSAHAIARTETRGGPLQGAASTDEKPVGASTPTSGQTRSLAQYAAATSYANLPQQVQERTRKVIFDELACAYFGRPSPGGKLAARYVEQFGGSPEVPILGSAAHAPAAYAAMANGTAGHGDEVDGAHVVGGHPGASIVHAASAIAVRQKAGGAELINAVALGYDVGVRLVEACGGKFAVRDRFHLTSDFLYAMGCTTAAARILRLDAERHCHALALATFQINGLYALYSEKNHISKSFCNGQYAFAGISAALMAQTGLEGNEDIIGSRDGLLEAWGDRTRLQHTVLDLGSAFKIMGGNFKFLNAGYPIHSPVEAALNIVRQHRIGPTDITSIVVGMPQNALRVVDGRDMHNISVQDMVSANLAKGGLKLAEQPFPEILADPRYQHVRAVIRAEVDPELQREFPDGRGARVTITTRSGARHSMRVDNPLGHSLRGEPSWDDLWTKWHDSLPGCNVARAFDMAQKLEQVPDAGALLRAFSGTNA